MAERRVDSAHIRAKIVKEAIEGMKPPKHIKLRDVDIPFWDNIIGARAEWTDVDLAQAANMARWQADLEMHQRKLAEEGDIIYDNDKPVINPRFIIAEKLATRINQVCSKIQVHTAATIGEAKDSRKKNTLKRLAIKAMEEVDDLIARPN